METRSSYSFCMSLDHLRSANSSTEIPAEDLAFLLRYITASLKNALVPIQEWADCTQDVLTRLWQGVQLDQWQWSRFKEKETGEREELSRAIEMVKKRAKRLKKHAPFSKNCTAVDTFGAAAVEAASNWDFMLDTAQRELSPFQKDVFLKIANGKDAAQISTELKKPSQRIYDAKCRAIKKLREVLATD